MKKLIAVLLCVLMAFGSLPQTIAMAAGFPTGTTPGQTDTVGGYDKVIDNATVNGWREYFNQSPLTTENAGGVWSDKSVFDRAEELRTAEGVTNQANAAYNNMKVGPDNFLVALSAIAANKEIVGYSTIPTDTMFILDVSQSMDNSQSIPTMVSAVNSAMHTLLSLNNHNRVGLVLYSGNDNTNEKANLGDATVLLPIARYTPVYNGNTPRYITYTGDRDDTTVRTVKGLQSGNKVVSETGKTTFGGTYVQAGIYLAQQELCKMDTTIETGLIQGGTTRKPVMVLMSDGLPTIATDQYATFTREDNSRNVGVTNMGTGSTSSSTDEVRFVTQLTAAWAKQKVENHYNKNDETPIQKGADYEEALFYTLYYNTSNDSSVANNAVLNPASSNNNLDGWWKTLLGASGGNVSFGQGNNRVTVTRDSVLPNITGNNYGSYGYGSYDEAWQDVQGYVDQYFSARNTDGFANAFNEIVNQIVLQSAYYPTLVEGSNHDFDGYIVIEDPLGEYMEVKEIEGISIGGHLFTGETLIQMMSNNQFGSLGVNSDNGWALIDAIEDRILGNIADEKVRENTAIGLAQSAWRYGQLGYNAETGKFSNYIGWLADENNNFLSFWHEGMTATEISQVTGAKQIMKSYGFWGVVGELDADSNLKGENMMHVAVRVATQLEDGDQTVTFGIPASLIPLIKYSVTVNSSSLENANSATLTAGGADHPIRLLMEVGLRNEINELTIAEITRNGADHHHNANGVYSFYTNRWGSHGTETDDGMITIPGMDNFHTAVSYYNPSTQNERFYYSEDSAVYTKDGENYVKYTGDAAPSGNEYYRIQYVFKATGTGNNAEIEKRYISLTSAVLGNAVKGENGWYIPQGTARGDVEGFTEYKNPQDQNFGGATDTLPYYTRALDPQAAGAIYHNYDLHGNNGRLQMTAATGIKLTKKFTAVEPGAEDIPFTLNVTFSVPDGATATVPGTVKVSFDGKNYQEVALTNNTVSVVLKANEYAYIYGALAGLKYTITEEVNSKYVPVEATLTGSDAITANTIVNVDFENEPKEAKELVITKTVTDPFGDKDATAEQRFDVTVTLVPGNITMDWSKVAITHSNETDGNKNVDSTNNKITFTIAHGESVVIKGIPEGVEYTVTEAETEGDGFALKAGTHTGIITDNDISIVNLVNNYTPSPVSPVNIFVTGEKNLYGRDWNVDDEFTFAIQYWTNTGWVQVKPEGVTVDETATTDSKAFDLSGYIQNFQFTEPGIYTFWVYEKEDSIGGVTYDTTHRSFSVEVIDDWSGKLKISNVTTTDGRVSVTKNETTNVYTVDTDFTNRYAPEGSASVEFAVEKTVNGNGYNGTLENFRFVLEQYQDESAWESGQGGTQVGEYVITDASGHDKFTLVFDASLLEKEYVSDQINSLNEESGEGEGANGEPASGEGEENSGAVILAEENKEIAKYKDTVLYYTLKEIEPENDIPGMNCTDDYYRIKVTLSDNGVGGVNIATNVETVDGGETGSVSDAAIDNNGSINVRFTNDYVLKPTGITFEGEKVIDGREFLDSDDFVFELYDAPNFTASGDPIQNVSVSTIDGSDRTKGSFNFAEITYDQNDIGTHYYVVKEKTGNLPGMTYSEEVYNITVTVGIKKDDAGAEIDELEATYTVTKVGGSAEDNSIVFTNKYEADEAEISVTKKWSGDTESRRPAIGSNDIAFELQYKAPGATGWETFAGEGLVTVDESITDNDDGTWTVRYILNYPKGTFGGYEFRVVETKIPTNYTASNNGEEFTGGIAKDGGTITNTYKTPYKPTPKTSLTIKKVWDDKNDKYEVRPDSVQVRIYANGERYTDVVLSENNGWSYTVRNLPKYEGGKRVEYTAVEINVPKYYSASYSTSSGSVVITNTYGDEPRNPATGAPVFEAFFADNVSSPAYLPKKREDED